MKRFAFRIGGRFVKGHPPLNGDIKGHPNWNTEFKGCFKKGHPGLRDSNNPNWKEDIKSLPALHQWVMRRLGKPLFCCHCYEIKRKHYQWANISRKYKRHLSDWIRLCVPCHQAYDGHRMKQWETRRKNAI